MSQKRTVPGRDHLQAGEPRAPVDVLGARAALGRPDVALEPLHQRQVVGVAAKQGHRRVGVAVDQARDERQRRRRRSPRRPAAARPPAPSSAITPSRAAQADRSPSSRTPVTASAIAVQASSAPASDPEQRLDCSTARLRSGPRSSSSIVSSRRRRPRWRGCRRRRPRRSAARARRRPTHSEAIVIPITSAWAAISRISAGVSSRGPRRLPVDAAVAEPRPPPPRRPRAPARAPLGSKPGDPCAAAPSSAVSGAASRAMKSSGQTNVPAELGPQPADRADRRAPGHSPRRRARACWRRGRSRCGST